MRKVRLALFTAALAVLGSDSLWAESAPSYTVKQEITVKQAGKPDRRCVVTAVTPHADGSFVYQLKVQETNEIITIHDRASTPSTPPAPTVPKVPVSAAKPMRSVPMPTNPPPPAPPALADLPFPGPAPIMPPPPPVVNDLPFPGLPPMPELPKANTAKPVPAKPVARKKDDPDTPAPKVRPTDRMTARIPVELPAMPWENSGLSLFGPSSSTTMPKPTTTPMPTPTPSPLPATETPPPNSVARRWANILRPLRPTTPTTTTMLPPTVPAPTVPTPTVASKLPDVPRLDDMPPIAVPPPIVPPVGPSPVVQNDRPTQLPDPVISAPVPPIVVNPVPKGLMIPVPERHASESRFAQEERVVQLGFALRDALLPSHREAAAEQLAEGAGATSATVRSMLMTAAANDPAGSVRACCLRSLSKMGIHDAAYEALLTTVKQDTHPLVRDELTEALSRMRR